jgi:hypothetical protein
MATTTNFGWTTPDDTDLVKDGASAIRTLGSAIDTSLVDLKGGTTGQVLSKASNTDMDFSWIAAGGSGWTKVTSSNFTSQTSVSIDNCFTSTYKYYRIFTFFTCSASNQLYMRLRASSSDNTSSTYSSGFRYTPFGNTATTAGIGATSASYFYMLDTVTNNIGQHLTIDISNPQTSDRTLYTSQGIWEGYYHYGAGRFDNNNVFDGFTIYPVSGNITGNVSVYGYGA